MSEGLRGGDSRLSSGEVARVRTEVDSNVPEQAPENCLVRFEPLSTQANGEGASAAGFLSCGVTDCDLRGPRTITGDVESGSGNVTASAIAEAKVLARARRQIANECLAWTSDPANRGQQVPNDRLPEILQRSQP